PRCAPRANASSSCRRTGSRSSRSSSSAAAGSTQSRSETASSSCAPTRACTSGRARRQVGSTSRAWGWRPRRRGSPSRRPSCCARMPLVRMTNLHLEPGEGSFEELISDVDDGLYLETNRSWSIDDKRLNFQFGTQMAWEIKGGKLGRLYRDATYTGITPVFWG